MRVLPCLPIAFLPSLLLASSRFSYQEIKELSTPRASHREPTTREDYLEDLAEQGRYSPVYTVHPKLGMCGPGMFTDLEPIGKGAFSTVFKAIHDPTKTPVALKVLKHSEGTFSRIRLEECLQHKVSFPTIREHYCTFTCDEGIIMVMEYVEGTTMFNYSHQHHPIPTELLKRWAAQLTATVMALHLNSIVFVDISPHNIMVTNDGRNIKLIDFGLAVDSKVVIPGHNDKLNGTPYYTSPENAESYLLGRLYANYARPSSDWYSMGMVLFDAATQRVLFNYEVVDRLAQKNRALSLWKLFGYIRNGYQMIDSDREGREDLMNFIAAITEVNPVKRLGTTRETYQEILDHPLFAGFDTLQKFIGID